MWCLGKAGPARRLGSDHAGLDRAGAGVSLLRYRPPLVTYRVVKARRMTGMQAQYLARKFRRLGRGNGQDSLGSPFEPWWPRAVTVVSLVGLSAGALLVLGAFALLTWFAILLLEAIV